MPEIVDAQSRIVVAKLVIEILREQGATELGAERFGSRSDDLLLRMAILIGQAEGRPMTASNLSGYVGQARPSVVRKLNNWEAAGLIVREGLVYKFPVAKLNRPRVLRAAESARRRVAAAAAALDE